MKYRSGKPGKRHKKVHFTKLSTKIYFTCITLRFKFYRLHFSVSKNISISNRLKKQEIFSLGIRHFSPFTCCLHNSISNHVNLNVHGLKQIQHEKSQVCPLQSWTAARYGPRARIISLLPGEEPGQSGSRGRWGRRRNFGELLWFQGWVSHLGSAAAQLRLTQPLGLAAFHVQSTAREKWPQQLSCFRFRGKGIPMKPNTWI